MISMSCTGCGAKLKAPDNAAGKRMTCPKCGTVLDVPEPIYEAEVVATPDDDPVDPYGFDDEKPVPLASVPEVGEARRPCPMCGEMIVRTAAKCRYCGEVFDPTLRKAESKKKKRKSSPDDEDMSTGDWVAAIICSLIGCIAGIVWIIQGKPKGKKMLAVSFVCIVLWNILSVVIKSAMENQ